jgi:hypothetical protein
MCGAGITSTRKRVEQFRAIKSQETPIQTKSDSNRKKSRWKILGISLVVLVPIALILIFTLSDLQESSQDKDSFWDNTKRTTGESANYSVSPQQMDLVDEFGYPDTFFIGFFTEEINGEEISVRMETWDYYYLLTSFSFTNGEFFESSRIEAVPDDVIFPAYYPMDFEEDMTFGQVRDTLGNNNYDEINVEDLELGIELPEQITLYFGDAVILGFADDMLAYVITVPIVPE